MRPVASLACGRLDHPACFAPWCACACHGAPEWPGWPDTPGNRLDVLSGPCPLDECPLAQPHRHYVEGGRVVGFSALPRGTT